METEQRENHLLRLLFMLLFWVFLRLSLTVTAIICIVQWVILWFQDEPIEKLGAFSKNLRLYQNQLIQFLNFESEQKPFPFSDWPEHS